MAVLASQHNRRVFVMTGVEGGQCPPYNGDSWIAAVAPMMPQPIEQLAELYRQDYLLWLEATRQLLQAGRFSELDIPHLIDEIDDMGRSEKRAFTSNLIVVIMHLLKYAHQPASRSNSWRFTLKEHRRRLQEALKTSPSLKTFYAQVLDECYQEARDLAATETGLDIDIFPATNPFTPDQILDRDYLPE